MPLAALAPYLADIKLACSETGEDPVRFAALILRESGAGEFLTPKGPGGTGDGGHGHGLCQIDDRTWGPWLRANDWQKPLVSFRQGCLILRNDRSYLKSLVSMPGVAGEMFERTVYAAYNCGPTSARRGLSLHNDPDYFTWHPKTATKGDYSEWIWNKAVAVRARYPELVAK